LPNRNNETDRTIRVLSWFWPYTTSNGLLTPREGCPHSGNLPGDSGNWGAKAQGHNELTKGGFSDTD
jgi:hypothetical protein